MKEVDITIFIVNGISNDDKYSWLNLSLKNIIDRLSGIHTFKVFLWNHDHNNPLVREVIERYSADVVEITINDVDLDAYDPDGQYLIDKGYRFLKGYHVHCTPLQLLYIYAEKHYSFKTFFTFDTDSWPLRNNWDLPLLYALYHDKMLVGIWRDELKAVIPPYIHPSCLGMRHDIFKESGLRFDTIPTFPLEDSLSHITAYVRTKFGEDSILKLRRNNSFQYHNVFNGVYDSLMYHHHFGSRFKDKKASNLKSFGWKDRNESMLENNIVMASSTKMVFEDTFNTELSFLYGHNAFIYKKYHNYLYSRFSKFRVYRLFILARKYSKSEPNIAFMILNQINNLSYILNNKRFIELYTILANKLGFVYESRAYKYLLEKPKSTP